MADEVQFIPDPESNTTTALMEQPSVASIITSPVIHRHVSTIISIIAAPAECPSRSNHKEGPGYIAQDSGRGWTKYIASASKSFKTGNRGLHLLREPQDLCSFLASRRESAPMSFIHDSITEMRKLQRAHADAKGYHEQFDRYIGGSSLTYGESHGFDN